MGRSRRRSDAGGPAARWQWPTGEPGVPGFRSQALKAACYEIARQTGGVVEAAVEGRWRHNFDHVVLRYTERRIAVLGHHWRGVLALAEAPQDAWEWPIRFLDDPMIGPALAAMLQARLLAAADLDMDWTRAGDPPGVVASRSDMAYWRPGSIGDVIFNLWD